MPIRALIEANTRSLRQAVALLGQIDGRTYAECPPGLAPHRVGGHLRHILEFYECFLEGLDSGVIDYDARRRDEDVETRRAVGLARLHVLIETLESRPLACRPVRVRTENGDDLLDSSVSRELQSLSSHTIHHFALMALTLRAHGFAVDRDFGMAPSTLRHREAAACAR